MTKKTVTIGIANEKEKNFEVETVATWKPTNVTFASDTVYFKHDKVFYSMKRLDYDSIFKKV